MDKIKLPTICGGYAGICWLFRYLYKEKLVESNNINEVLDGLEKYITKTFYNYYINDTDFLHGGLGIAFYFLLSDTIIAKTFVKCIWIDLIKTNKIKKMEVVCGQHKFTMEERMKLLQILAYLMNGFNNYISCILS